MPAKENCKATQIFDADYELFDFDEEVEPMLNVLCSKTLEQARMELLEETELSTIMKQKKEYEEVRNAELIEAQRNEFGVSRAISEATVRTRVRDGLSLAPKHRGAHPRPLDPRTLAGRRGNSAVHLGDGCKLRLSGAERNDWHSLAPSLEHRSAP